VEIASKLLQKVLVKSRLSLIFSIPFSVHQRVGIGVNPIRK